jgi:hypothetical protein
MARVSVEERPDVAARVLARTIQSNRKALATLSRLEFKSFKRPRQPFPVRFETGRFTVSQDHRVFEPLSLF